MEEFARIVRVAARNNQGRQPVLARQDQDDIRDDMSTRAHGPSGHIFARTVATAAILAVLDPGSHQARPLEGALESGQLRPAPELYNAYYLSSPTLAALDVDAWANADADLDNTGYGQGRAARAMRYFALNCRDAVLDAIGAGQGLWMVRRAGGKGIRVLAEGGFRELESELATTTSMVRKVVVDIDAVRMTTTLGGRLEGGSAADPAICIIDSQGSGQSFYAMGGQVLTEPVDHDANPAPVGYGHGANGHGANAHGTGWQVGL